MVFSENNSSYLDYEFISIDESVIKDIGRIIRNTAEKFIGSIKELILKCIALIENNVFTKNKFFYKNKDKIVQALEGKTFEGYLFRIFQDGYGAIAKLQAAVDNHTSDIILNKSYADSNIMDYIRGLMINASTVNASYVLNCTMGKFPAKAKEYIYGSNIKELHMVNNIYGGVSGMIDRMMDKRFNIDKLKNLYKSFERYTKSMINTKKDHIEEHNLHRWIEITKDHMNTCHLYMTIIVQAIKDEYSQSYKLCTSALQ